MNVREIQTGAEEARRKAKEQGQDTIAAVTQYLSKIPQEQLKPLYEIIFKKGKKKFSSELMAKRLAEEHFCRGDKLNF